MPPPHPTSPLALSDEDLGTVQDLARPLHPAQRGAFLRDLARELERCPEIGAGIVARTAKDVQRRYLSGTTTAARRAETRFKRRPD
jgi:hypothetical protein